MNGNGTLLFGKGCKHKTLRILHANNEKLRIYPNFEEEIEAECHFKIKLRYKDHEVQILQSKEPVFPMESGVSFEILDSGWESIDITFRIIRINERLYIGPTVEPYFSGTITVQDVRVHVDVEVRDYKL